MILILMLFEKENMLLIFQFFRKEEKIEKFYLFFEELLSFCTSNCAYEFRNILLVPLLYIIKFNII